ncbi:MAG: choice-of-anchor Q domain-containing protein [Thermoguttaceae bacterium]
MKFSLTERLSAAFSRRTDRGFTAGKNNYRRRTRAQGQRGLRLGLEQLEDRCLLSILTVTSSQDSLGTPGIYTLRDAIAQANKDGTYLTADTISFASNLNGQHIYLSMGPLQVAEGTNVSIWGYSQITLNGDNAGIFQVASGGTLFLEGLTLAGGAANGDGGAIDNAGTLTVQECTFTGNTAQNAFSGPLLPNKTAPAKGAMTNGSDITGPLGGAIYNTGTLVTSYSDTFTDNSAAYGGAIANGPGGIANLQSVACSGNSASQWGGGIYNAGRMTVYLSTLSGNTAELGGGLYNDGGTLTINTSTLAGNTATGAPAGISQGGALYNNGTMTLSASTVSANAAYQGGGIYNSTFLTMDDTIVAGNTLAGSGASDPDMSGGGGAAGSYNLIGDGAGSPFINGFYRNQVGTSIAPIDPRLAPLGNHGGPAETMPLLSASPALGTGGPLTSLTATINATQTFIPVVDPAAIASTALDIGIQIDSEQMTVTGVDLANDTLTVSRGLMSVATSHNADAGVYMAYDQCGTALALPGAPALGAVQPTVASHLVFSTQPGNTTAGQKSTPRVQVSVEDAAGNVVLSDNSIVSLALSDNGTLSGTAAVAAVDGVATFNNLWIDTAGTGYTLSATDGKLSGATSDSFSVTAGAPFRLAFTVQPTGALEGATITPPVQVSVEDQYNNLVTTDSSSVTVAIDGSANSGTLGGTPTQAAVGGVATFGDLSISQPGKDYFLMATDGTLNGVVSAGFNITPRQVSLVVNSSQDSITTPTDILTLREAVNRADADGALGCDDTISFAPNLSGGNDILLQEGNLVLTPGANVTIWGTGITLNGDSDNLFQVDSGASLLLNGFTMAGGTAGNGGAINNAGTLTLEYCTFTGNSATGSNTTGLGGAIYNTGTLITSSPNVFTKNTAWAGGAVANASGGIASLESDTYSGNAATQEGGGIYNAGAMTVYGCTISGNKAQFGGGLDNDGGTVTVNTATLAGNTATGPLSGSSTGQGAGGGLYNNGVMTVSASTISGNAGYQGGGIYGGSSGYGNSLTLVDTIVAGNKWLVPGNSPTNPTAPFYPDLANASVAGACNLIGDGTGLTGIKGGVYGNQVGTASAPINPLLAPLGNYGGVNQTMPPLSCSPALAAGGPVTTLTEGIGPQDTLLPVIDAAVFESTPLVMYFEIDGELMALQSGNASSNLIRVSTRQTYSGYTPPANHFTGHGLYLVSNPLGLPPSLPPTIGAVQPAATQLLVTSAADPASLAPGTLRAAVKQANTDAANGISDTIMFAPAQMGTDTVTLEQGPLELHAGSGITTIDGGGQVLVSGGGASGVYVVDYGAQLDLTGQVIEGGQAATGGGIDNGGTLTVTNCDVVLNKAVNPAGSPSGGGIDNTGTATLTDCTIADNSATGPSGQIGDGGGIYNTGTLTATDCTFSGNTASNAAHPSAICGQGGAIFSAAGASVSLTATTISANSAYSGGGIAASSSYLILTDTIVAGNTLTLSTGTGTDILGAADAGSSYNMIGKAGGLTGMQAKKHNVVAKNAYLAPLGRYGGTTLTMALLPGSPAVGNGGGIASLSTDQRGDPVTNPPCIGAYQTVKVSSLHVVFLGTAAPAKHAPPVGGPPVTTAQADTAFNVQVAALDAAGNPIPNDNVPITASYTVQGSTKTYNVLAPAGTPPGTPAGMPVSIQLKSDGTWTGPIVLHYPGTDKLTVTCGTINQGYSINVSQVQPTSFSVDSPAAGAVEVAGKVFNATVNAWDAGGLQPIGYKGPVWLSVVGGTAGNGMSCKMTDGTWTGPLIVTKAGKNVTLTATAGSLPCTPSGAFTVKAGNASKITVAVTVPGLVANTVTAGGQFTVAVSAFDGWSNPALFGNLTTKITCNPTQTVNIASSVMNAANTQQTNTVSLDQAGSFTLTVTLGSLPAYTCKVTVNAGPADHFVVTSQGNSVGVGAPILINVQAKDVEGNNTTCSGGGIMLSLQDYSSVISADPAHAFQPAVALPQGNIGLYYANVFIDEVGEESITAYTTTGPGVTGTMQNPINVTQPNDWYTQKLTNAAMQRVAREAHYYGNRAIGYNGMLQLFSTAEGQEMVYGPTVGNDLQTLLTNYNNSNVMLSPEVKWLTNAVINPDPHWVSFDASYYVRNTYGQTNIPMVYSDSSGDHFGVSGGGPGLAASAQLQALVNQWFLGTVYPSDNDPYDNISNQLPYSTPGGTLSLYGPTREPMFTDVQQGGVGDCWVMAAAAAVAYKFPGDIESMIHGNGNGTYTLHVYNCYSRLWQYVTVDNELPNGGGTYDSPSVYNNTVMWVALTEKACAEWNDWNHYAYSWLSGASPNQVSSNFYIAAMTGLGTYFNYFGGLSEPKWYDVRTNLKPTASMPNGRAVCLATHKSPPNGELMGPHEYAILDCDPSGDWSQTSDPSKCKFLLYNPHGDQAASTLATPINDTTTQTVQVTDASSIGPGDFIQIDSELMLVKSVDHDTQKLQVQRAYNTPPTVHLNPSPVYLSFDESGAWTQMENASVGSTDGGLTQPGLFTLTGDDLNGDNFNDISNNTGCPCVRTAGGSTAAAMRSASIPAAAADATRALIAAPGASPGGGNLPAMPLVQAATLDPPQWEPTPAAAATAANRLAALDAVLAANTFAGQGQSTGPAGGSLSGDDTDALFAADDPAAWRVKLAELKTGLRVAST